jgi:hypothetical protein
VRLDPRGSIQLSPNPVDRLLVKRSRFRSTLLIPGLLVGALLFPGGILAASDGGGRRAARHAVIGGNSKADCVYARHSIRVLHAFERKVHRNIHCVMVFNDVAQGWSRWAMPWFVKDADRDTNWKRWATAPGTHRQLIISQSMFPSRLMGSEWLQAGASGAYEKHARALARHLVAAGLGHSVIRLGAEANLASAPWAITTDSRSLSLWRKFWRQTVLAMRSVHGARFQFDWCINARDRPIRLTKWYPGNDVVDIIGIDAYDSGVALGLNRWSEIYNRPDGIRDVLHFAGTHGKPMSFPEWGLLNREPPTLGGGDDHAYINGIARIVRRKRVAYQSYFDKYDSAVLLTKGSSSLVSYRRHFGRRGDSLGH